MEKLKKAKDKGWGVGVQHWEVKNAGEWMGDSPSNNLSMRASHQDQVVDMPTDSTLIAGSDFCPIAGFQTGSMLTFQGHPEFSRSYAESLINKRVERIGQQTVDTARETLKQEVDGDKVGEWMIAFIKNHLDRT